MLYVEAPAGVGFSYSRTPSDYTTSDNKTGRLIHEIRSLLINSYTADDNYTFLKNFFAIFSSFKNNDFYVSGTLDLSANSIGND